MEAAMLRTLVNFEETKKFADQESIKKVKLN